MTNVRDHVWRPIMVHGMCGPRTDIKARCAHCGLIREVKWWGQERRAYAYSQDNEATWDSPKSLHEQVREPPCPPK